MDGDPVTGEPSKVNQYAAMKITVPDTLGELFMNLCPHYMSMGMTYDEYWNRNTKVHRAYREAWEQKKAFINWRMWMQGAYVYDALLKASPVLRGTGSGKVEPGKYPEEPYPLTGKEAREREEAKRQARLERLMAVLSKESEATKKKEASGDGRD